MNEGTEAPVFDLESRDIHITRITGPGPTCYRIEQGKGKVVLTADEFLRIAGLIKADCEIVAQRER